MHFITTDLTPGVFQEWFQALTDFVRLYGKLARDSHMHVVLVACARYIMAAYSGSFTEVKHVEFTQTILEATVEFKGKDVRLSGISPVGKVRMLPLK